MKCLFFFFIFTIAELSPSERKCMKSMLYSTDDIIVVQFEESHNEAELRQTVKNLGSRVIETILCSEERQKRIESHQKEEEEYYKHIAEQTQKVKQKCLDIIRETEQWNEQKWFYQFPKEIPKCLSEDYVPVPRGPMGYIPCVNQIKIKI